MSWKQTWPFLSVVISCAVVWEAAEWFLRFTGRTGFLFLVAVWIVGAIVSIGEWWHRRGARNVVAGGDRRMYRVADLSDGIERVDAPGSHRRADAGGLETKA